MVIRWSETQSNPYAAYLAMLGTMPGQTAQPQLGSSPVGLQGAGADQFSMGDQLPPELQEFVAAALRDMGIDPKDAKDALANMSAQDLLQLLIDYFANEMHQKEQKSASPPRNAGNMNGGQRWGGAQPTSWNGGGGSSGGGSSGGTSSGGTSSGGGPGGPLQNRTNGAGLPAPATGQSNLPAGLRPNAANGARVVREELGFDGVIGGIGQRSGPSDHPHGNAIDVMSQSDVAKGREVAEHFRQNADQLGVKYVIYQQQIASPSSNPPWSWRPMEDRGDPTQNHMDHVHISFN